MSHENPQLAWVCGELDALGVAYWLDSGTLLGMMREGQLLKNDNDIDLGVWADEAGPLLRDPGRWRAAGYKPQVFSLGGRPFKLKLYPSAAKVGPLRIDINLFREEGGSATCPQQVPASMLEPGNSLQRLSRVWRRPGRVADVILEDATRLWNAVFRPGRVAFDAFPWKRFTTLREWRIPAHYFRELRSDGPWATKVPRDWEAYLTFRYGDWRVPAPHWVFHRDDGGLSPRTEGRP